MAKFNIQRSRATLPGRAAVVRADLDVRAGGQQVARAYAGLGESLANLGLKMDLIQADTQFNEARMKARQEHVRLMLALPGIEPENYEKEYENSLKTRQGFIPKNKRAANAYNQFVNDYIPQWGFDVVNAKQEKVNDNYRAVGFRIQQKGIEDGNLAEYKTHLAKGKILGVYTEEERAKYWQSAIDQRKIYVRSEETRIKAAEKEARAQYVEQIEQEFLVKLRGINLSETDVMNSALDVDKKQEWLGYIESQRKEILTGKDVIIDQLEKRRLGDLIPDIWRNRISIDDFIKEVHDARYPLDKSPAKIDDAVFDELVSKARTELKAVQNESISDMIRDVSGELGVVEQSAMLIMLSIVEDKDDRERMQNDNQSKAARVNQFEEMIYDFLKDNPKAQRDEFENFKKGIMPYIRNWEVGMPLPIAKPEQEKIGAKVLRGPYLEPQFEMNPISGLPVRIFNIEGDEEGLRLKTGEIFRVGSIMKKGGNTYIYQGNNQWLEQ